MPKTAQVVRKETPRLEDYLEAILNLVSAKGDASTVDLANHLGVKPPTVSGMLQRLDERGYLLYEPYRGIRLTTRGEKVARSVIERHQAVSQLLDLLGVEEKIAYEDTEGIEHHVHPATIHKVERLVDFLHDHPEELRLIRDYIEK